MMLKDSIFIKWFSVITFSESMFGAKNILIEITDKKFEPNEIEKEEKTEIIGIKVKNPSKICITICFKDDTKIELDKISYYFGFNLLKIENNKTKEVKLSDDKFINKIFEKLDSGNYQLSFKYNKILARNTFYYQIKYYDDSIEIKAKNIKFYEDYFPKIRQINYVDEIIACRFLPPAPQTKNDPFYLPQDPTENNIIINYDKNNVLYWIEPPKKFDINEYKFYSYNYKDVIITIVYQLLYFVPIFIIIYYIEKKEFEIRAPEDQSLTIDENYNILSISKKLGKYAKIGETLFDYNSNVKKSYLNNNKENYNNIINNKQNNINRNINYQPTYNNNYSYANYNNNY